MKEACMRIDNQGPAECVDDCALSKITRDSFRSSSKRSSRPLELIHSDVAFVNADSYEGHNAFVLFIDDFSNFVYGFIMGRKGQAAEAFISYVAMVQFCRPF